MAEPDTSKPNLVPSRRLALGAVALIGLALLARPYLPALFPVELTLEPLADPQGFRRLAGAAGVSGVDPLFGIGAPVVNAMPSPPPDLCTRLFGARPSDGVVSIALFTDVRCVYCRVLEPRVQAIEAAERGRVQVTWHELPLLGEPSVLAARASLAARRQRAYAPFHAALMRSSFVPTPELIEVIAADLDLDVALLRRDMRSAAVENRLASSMALGRRFGFIGTPAMVVGRTAVLGAIDDRTLRALIERELADGPITACA